MRLGQEYDCRSGRVQVGCEHLRIGGHHPHDEIVVGMREQQDEDGQEQRRDAGRPQQPVAGPLPGISRSITYLD